MALNSHPPLRAVVVGAGTGGTLSIDALKRSSEYELAGIADVSEASLKRVRERFPYVATSTDHAQLFADIEPDVVCVSTWAPSHADITAAALGAGARGLLVEKPLGDNVANGRRVIELTRAAHVPFVVPHGLMAQAAPLEIIARVTSGQLGRLSLVEMESSHWDIVNAGIHWIQFFLMLAAPSPIARVLTGADVSTRTFRDGMQVETESITVATTTDGVRLMLQTGDELTLLRPDTECVMRILGSEGVIEYGAWDDHYSLQLSGEPRREVRPEPLAVSGHQFHLEHLAELVRSRRIDEAIPLTSMNALEVVDAAYLSNRIRAAVTVPVAEAPLPAAVDWDPGTPYSGVGGGRNGRAR